MRSILFPLSWCLLAGCANGMFFFFLSTFPPTPLITGALFIILSCLVLVCVCAVMPDNHGAVLCVWAALALFILLARWMHSCSPCGDSLFPRNPQISHIRQTTAPLTLLCRGLTAQAPNPPKPFNQRQLSFNTTTKPRPYQPSPKSQTNPCKPPDPTHYPTQRPRHQRQNLNRLRPPRPPIPCRHQYPTAPRCGDLLSRCLPSSPFPFPPFPPSGFTISTRWPGLTTTANLSPPYRLRPTPPPGVARCRRQKGRRCTHLRRAQLGPPAQRHPQAHPSEACPGGHASTPSGTASLAHHASIAGNYKVLNY